jgi:hypothetical protein
MPVYADLRPEAIRARAAALARFEAWEMRHPSDPSPEVALSGVALLYELLPPQSRARQVDPRGVAAMHRALSVLGRR